MQQRWTRYAAVLTVLGSLLAGTQPAVAATLHRAATHLHAVVTPTTARVGSVVTVSGTVSPTAAAALTLQRLVGKTWTTVGHAKADKTGAYTIRLRAPKKPARWTVRVTRAATSTTKAAATGAVHLRLVKSAFVVSAAPAATTVHTGQILAVSGKVSPSGTGSVLVERRSGATWVRLAKAALSKKSTYSARVVLARGSYVLRVRKAFSPAVAEGVSKAFTVVVNPPAPVVTTTPPAAVVGRPYSTTLAATSDGPVTWSVSAGALPAGLALSSTGLLSGRPVVVGPTAVTVAATDSLGQTGTLAVTLTVAPVGLRAMGRNSNGQLGTGSTTDSSVPALAQSPGGSWLTIAACENYTLGLRTDGTVWSWGSNAQAQLGDGTTADHASPTQIQALTDIVAIAAGDSSAYAVSRTGAVFAWGDNSAGQLGNGSVVASRQPIPVPGLTGVTSVAAGDGWAVAVRGDGTATSWGYNLRGNLGNGAPGGYRATPGPVVGLTGAVAVAGAGNDTYALLADGTVRAWGANNTGQLGDGFTGDSAVPRAVYGLTGVTALAASVLGGYALHADGTVSGWGGSDNYRLGNNEYDNPRYIPVTIPVTGVVAIAAGYASGYALTAAGTIVDWGQDATGELGDGHPSEQGSPTPAPLAGLTGVVAIAAGNGESAFALVAGG